MTEIGSITKLHGIKGEVRILLTYPIDMEDTFTTDFPIFIECNGLPVPFFIESVRQTSNYASIIKFIDIDDVKKATALLGNTLCIEQGIINTSNAEGFHKYINYKVQDETYGTLGTITRVDDSTPNILFEVEEGNLLPAHDTFITGIDHDSRTLHTKYPEGLLSC